LMNSSMGSKATRPRRWMASPQPATTACSAYIALDAVLLHAIRRCPRYMLSASLSTIMG